jgi:hypothetical protein
MLLLALACACRGQGGSAVITLVMPPPGGEGYTALQSGAALAEGATAAYHNPAALAELQRSTGSSLGFTDSRQDLLPILNLKEMYQTFLGADFVAADSAGGTDVGVGLFRNQVRFGKNAQTDAQGREIATFDNEETVWGLAIGARLGMPVSVGLGAKFIDSHLAASVTSAGEKLDGTAHAWAFDAGILAMPRFSPTPAWRLPLVITPSFALVAANLGPDVFYNEASERDPLPATYTAAGGLRAEGWDLVSATVHAQRDVEWTHRSDRWAPVDTRGFAWNLLGFAGGGSRLDDAAGMRRERHSFVAYEFDLRRWHRILARLAAGDFSSPSESMDKGYSRGYLRAFGGKARISPRVTAGVRRIRSDWNGIREGQRGWFLAFSL